MPQPTATPPPFSNHWLISFFSFCLITSPLSLLALSRTHKDIKIYRQHPVITIIPFLFHLFSTAQKITQFGDPKSSALFRVFEILSEVRIPLMDGSAFNFGCASVTFPFPFLCFAFTKFVNGSLLDQLFSGR
jgi:hypothetical protein